MARATVYDVSEKAGVSTATVSFTFRRPDKVRPKTRERVLQAAKELEYIPSGSARGLARGSNGALGIYAFDMLIERPQGSDAEDVSVLGEDVPAEPDVLTYPLYVDEVLRGFELECWKHDQGLFLGAAKGRDDHQAVTDIAGRVDGLAIMPSMFNLQLPLELLCKTMPIVLISMDSEKKLPAAHVLCDNRSGMRQLLDHLIDVHQISSLAFVGGFNAEDVSKRYEAFHEYLHERGVESMEWFVDDSVAGSDERLVRLCEAINMGKVPRALVCGTDQTAFEVLQLLEDAGLSVPDDVIVTGFDGILAGRLMKPSLTTVRQPMEAMGRVAARLLDERNGKPWDESVAEVLPVRLIPRESCGCAG